MNLMSVTRSQFFFFFEKEDAILETVLRVLRDNDVVRRCYCERIYIDNGKVVVFIEREI